FAHTTNTVYVNTTFLAPAWAEDLMLNYRASWIDSATGAEYQRGDEQSLNLRLKPNNMEAVTTGILEMQGSSDSKPLIFPPQAHYEFIAEQPGQSLVIPGRNLWRNPEVFIDGYKATRVKLISDMRALLATWEYAIPNAPGNERDLRV